MENNINAQEMTAHIVWNDNIFYFPHPCNTNMETETYSKGNFFLIDRKGYYFIFLDKLIFSYAQIQI